MQPDARILGPVIDSTHIGTATRLPTIDYMSTSFSTDAVPVSASSSPLLQGLNPEQQAAVGLPAQHALILAGAGSGKTRVLTTRIAWLLQTRQVSPGGLIA
ncbi:MAG: hypothetical protein RL700_2013, partial [Pseudomonadota bacterium]